MNFDTVTRFENLIAEFYNAPYAVSTDCCTHAIELCLRYLTPLNIKIPTHTYVSIPMTAIKVGTNWNWQDIPWTDYYQISDCGIIDSAVYWKENGYIPGSFMCLSFQYKKHLALGKGGAILCSNYKDYCMLKQLSYDGRELSLPWADQNIKTLGYHYYMTPETAQLGINQLPDAIKKIPKSWNYTNYPDLTKMEVFSEFYK